MKIAAILLCTLCVLTYKVNADDDDNSQDSCLEREGLSIADLPQLFSDQSDESNRKRGCLEACYLQKIGLMTDNEINVDEINAQIEKVMSNNDNAEKMRDAISKCAKDAAGDDQCMVAQKFAQCGLQQFQLSIRNMIQQLT
ncbi:uncharacterized protein LOC144473212 [Augochlora pura]